MRRRRKRRRRIDNQRGNLPRGCLEMASGDTRARARARSQRFDTVSNFIASFAISHALLIAHRSPRDLAPIRDLATRVASGPRTLRSTNRSPGIFINAR